MKRVMNISNNNSSNETILAILLSLMLNANVIRYSFNLSENSSMLYIIYALCGVVGLYKIRKLVLYDDVKMLGMFAIPICIYGMLSLIWLQNVKVEVLVKLIYLFIIYIIGMNISLKCIKKILRYTMIVNLIYAFFILALLDKMMEYLFRGDANYLNLTLTLGLALTMSLTYVVADYYSKVKVNNLVVGLLVSLILFGSCSAFLARGSVLFPVLVALTIILIIGIKKSKKCFVMLLGSGAMLLGAVTYYLDNASDLAVSRMWRLFNDVEDESRIGIWTKTISSMLDDGWFIWGGGMNAFVENLGFYPHNIFFQFWGEYGALGIVFMLYITFKSIIYFYKANVVIRMKCEFNYYDKMLYVVCGGMLYLLFSFCKSFSCYDAYTLFFMLGMSVKISRYSIGCNRMISDI